jgi:acyl carrier protein
MGLREKIVDYIQSQIDPEFDADADVLTQVLDSVSLLQLVMFIDQDLGIPLDLSNLTLDAFVSVDAVVETLSSVQILA